MPVLGLVRRALEAALDFARDELRRHQERYGWIGFLLFAYGAIVFGLDIWQRLDFVIGKEDLWADIINALVRVATSRWLYSAATVVGIGLVAWLRFDDRRLRLQGRERKKAEGQQIEEVEPLPPPRDETVYPVQFTYVTWHEDRGESKDLYLAREDGGIPAAGCCEVIDPFGDASRALFRAAVVHRNQSTSFVVEGQDVRGLVLSLRYPDSFKGAPPVPLPAGRYSAKWKESIYGERGELVREDLITICEFVVPLANTTDEIEGAPIVYLGHHEIDLKRAEGTLPGWRAKWNVLRIDKEHLCLMLGSVKDTPPEELHLVVAQPDGKAVWAEHKERFASDKRVVKGLYFYPDDFPEAPKVWPPAPGEYEVSWVAVRTEETGLVARQIADKHVLRVLADAFRMRKSPTGRPHGLLALGLACRGWGSVNLMRIGGHGNRRPT